MLVGASITKPANAVALMEQFFHFSLKILSALAHECNENMYRELLCELKCTRVPAVKLLLCIVTPECVTKVSGSGSAFPYSLW